MVPLPFSNIFEHFQWILVWICSCLMPEPSSSDWLVRLTIAWVQQTTTVISLQIILTAFHLQPVAPRQTHHFNGASYGKFMIPAMLVQHPFNFKFKWFFNKNYLKNSYFIGQYPNNLLLGLIVVLAFSQNFHSTDDVLNRDDFGLRKYHY